MLLVPTVVRPSPIAGFGLFAAAPIPAETTIWTFHPSVDWRLEPEQMHSFPEPLTNMLRQWCYEEPDGRFVLCGDNAKFMNHSFSPNCLDVPPEITVTSRDIETGEELTCDYRAIDLESARTGLVEWQQTEGIR